MNVVALRPMTPDAGTFPAIDGRVARVEIFDDMAAAEPAWRAHNLATPYQNYDFLKFWQRHVGQSSGMTPFIVVAYNAAGTPLFLWPFGCRKRCALRVVEFLGGKHANFNMALWRRDAAAEIAADDLRAVLRRIGERADIVKLINQPLTWAGTSLVHSTPQPAAASRQSLPPCVSSSAFLSPPSGHKPYFREDHFSGGRPPRRPRIAH